MHVGDRDVGGRAVVDRVQPELQFVERPRRPGSRQQLGDFAVHLVAEQRIIGSSERGDLLNRIERRLFLRRGRGECPEVRQPAAIIGMPLS